MSHLFRSESAAAAAEAFEHWGEAALFKPVNGPSIQTRAIDDTSDVVDFVARVRARRTGRTLDLPRETIVARPVKGDTITIGALTYTILENAECDDALGLVWTCRVSVWAGHAASLAFVLAAPLCTAGAALGPPLAFELQGPAVFATAFTPVAAHVAAQLAAPAVSAAAELTDGRSAVFDGVVPSLNVATSATISHRAAATISFAPPALITAGALSLVTGHAAALAGPVAAGSAVGGVTASASIGMSEPGVTTAVVAPHTASVALLLPHPALVGLAVLSNGPVAELFATLPAPSATAATASRVAGAVSVNPLSPSVSSTARVGVLPYAGVALAAPGVTASSAVRGAGSASADLPPASVLAAGQLSVATVNAAALPSPLASGVSILTLGAATTRTLSPPVIAAAASVALAPVATANMPGLSAAGVTAAALSALAAIGLNVSAASSTAIVETTVSYKTLTYVGGKSAAFAGSTGTNTNVALNSGLAGGVAASVSAGDFVIIAYAVGSTADRALTISGYTLVASELYANGTTYDANLRVAYKFMPSTPDTTAVLGPTGATADGGAYAVHVWRNVDPTNPLDVTPTTATGTGTSRANPPAITPATPGAVVLAASAGAAATGTTAYVFASSANLVQANQAATNDGRAALASYSWTSGALDPAASSAGSNNAADSWASITMALRPAVASALGPKPVLEASGFLNHALGSGTSYNETGITVPSGLVNSLLVVFVTTKTGAASTTSTATWNGASMDNLHDAGENDTNRTVLYAIKNPAAGAQTLALGFSGAAQIRTLVVGYAIFSGVDQTSPTGPTNHNTTGGSSMTVTPQGYENSYALAHFCGDMSETPPDLGGEGGVTDLGHYEAVNTFYATMITQPTIIGSQDMYMVFTPSGVAAAIGVSIRPVGTV